MLSFWKSGACIVVFAGTTLWILKRILNLFADTFQVGKGFHPRVNLFSLSVFICLCNRFLTHISILPIHIRRISASNTAYRWSYAIVSHPQLSPWCVSELVCIVDLYVFRSCLYEAGCNASYGDLCIFYWLSPVLKS